MVSRFGLRDILWFHNRSDDVPVHRLSLLLPPASGPVQYADLSLSFKLVDQFSDN